MKRYALPFLAAALLLASCEKPTVCPEEPHNADPTMQYTNLPDIEVKQGTHYNLDLDGDGAKDFTFQTWHIGDPAEGEDEILFFAGSETHSQLFAAGENESPAFYRNERIPFTADERFPGHEWSEVAMVHLAEKNIPAGGVPYWRGAWKEVSHRYLAVQVKRGESVYTGWVELSFNTAAGKLILHRAAISTVPGKAVTAGR
ncbi:MAG TPA: hypothetical protein VHK69_17555 [Chitinophagaceae bacterium]|nr:hypothetical protein [Chitinophagaceae bacterium]